MMIVPFDWVLALRFGRDGCEAVAGSRFRVGLLALPLCGAAPTFFAAAKKVGKESSFSIQSASSRPRHRRLVEWTGSSECPHKTHRAWTAHDLTSHNPSRAGSAQNSFGTALRAAVGYARETNEEEVHADQIDRSAAKRAGAIGAEPVRCVARCVR